MDPEIFDEFEGPHDGSWRYRFSRVVFDSISDRDWTALLRFYRILRIRLSYADPGSPDLDGLRAQGMSYGMLRAEAKEHLRAFAEVLDEHEYIGSK